MVNLRFFTTEIVLFLCTSFLLVLSSPINISLQNVNELLVQSALHSFNEYSPTHHTYKSGHLTSAQKLEEPPDVIYRLTFNLNPVCKESIESCPGESCTIDLKQDELGIIYVQKESIQCMYLYPQSSQNNIVQDQDKEFNNDNQRITKDQNDIVAMDIKTSNSNYCAGCPYDLNPHLPGLLAFNRQIEKQMDEVMTNDFKHVIVSIVRVTRAVPPSTNIVQYQLLVKVGESDCLKSSSSSDCILKPDSPIKMCLVSFEEQPWQQNSRKITKNNCTEIFHNNGDVTAAENLVNESYTIAKDHSGQRNENAYDGLTSILLDNFTSAPTDNIEKQEEQHITEHPFIKLVLNKSKDEEKSGYFEDKNKEFDKFLENFDSPIKTNDNSKISQTQTNERIILSETNIPNIINENVNQLDINTVERSNKSFYKKKRSIIKRPKRGSVKAGAPTSKDVNDPEIKQYANLGLTKLSQLSSSKNEPIIVNITWASVQVVSGLLYKINAKVGLSDCSKGVQDNCQLASESEIKDCLITVWSQPWLDKGSPDVKVDCNVSARKKRSLKGAFYSQKMLTRALRIKHERMFGEFIKNFNKNYSSDEEKEYRFKIFEKNLRFIEKLRMSEQGTAEYGITMFGDLTREEFKKQYLGLRPDLRTENQIPIPQAEIPDIRLPVEFDWRHYNAVTPVKNQGSCGSCWAFSVTGNIEGQYAMKHGKLLSLSEQELVDCDNLDDGCDGGLPDNAYRAIEVLGGLELETDYPYEAETEKCHLNKKMIKVQVASAVNITSNETQMAQWLVKNGPISIGINANAMQFYMGGISHPWKILCDPDNLDHGVLIVGYGVHKYPIYNKTMPYWIIKNSWGPRWGEQGYYRVYRGDGTCGLNNMASSAVVS